ncbi:M42 family metallopeptidase [Thermosulfuriphilus sp.]
MTKNALDWSLLERLCKAPGVPGAEEAVAEMVIETISQILPEAEFERDALGNVIFHRPGPGPRLLLDAHLDEVGFLVRKIEKGGFVRVIPIGGIDPRVCYGQQVVIWGEKPVIGIFVATPPHLREPTREVPEIDEMLIDTGLGSEVEKVLSVGDPVTFASGFKETPFSIMARALDDRVGLFVMIEALKRVPQTTYDLYLLASVSEEIGLKGAKVAGERIRPQLAICLEGTMATDIPGTPESKITARLGRGPEIRMADARFLADRALCQKLAQVAQEAGIPYQLVVKNKGGTNAAALQLAALGVRATAVSVPVRYIHAPWTLALKADIEATVSLIACFLEDL